MIADGQAEQEEDIEEDYIDDDFNDDYEDSMKEEAKSSQKQEPIHKSDSNKRESLPDADVQSSLPNLKSQSKRDVTPQSHNLTDPLGAVSDR